MSENRSIEKQLSFRNIRLLRREELGHGSFGLVCKAQCDQLICAAKVIYRVLRQAVVPDPGREHRQPNRRFQSEIDFLKHVHHPNIVQYLGTYEDPDSGDLVLLMELMDESLTHFLEGLLEDIPYHTQVNLSYDIAQALAFLHAHGIIHRDLSSNNVLLLAGTRAKVTDFGMSRFNESGVSMTLSPGTPVFMAPEALDQPHAVYTEKLDNFSFGVLMVQIMTRQYPDPGNRFEIEEVISPRTNKKVQAKIDVPEVERRRGHIDLIQQDHPLLPMALDCLKDVDQERPSSQELCGRFTTLKRLGKYEESSQRGSGQTIREQLQTQNEQHQVEIREKNEQMQAQNQQHQAKIREKDELIQLKDHEILTLRRQHEAQITEKNEQIQLKDHLMQARARQHQREIEAKALENNQLAVRLKQASDSRAQVSDFDSGEKQLRVLNEQLVEKEQITATLQEELLKQDRRVNELSDLLAAKDRENRRLSVQQLASPVASSTAQRAQSSEGPINMTWYSVPNVPYIKTLASSAVIGDQVYFKYFDKKTIYEFNSRIGVPIWSKLPENPLDGFTLVNIEGVLTTVGGGGDSFHELYSRILYSFNAQGQYWSETLPRMPTERSSPGALYTSNTLVVAGGYNTKDLSTVEILNTLSRQWSCVRSLPFETSQPSLCTDGSHIYVHPGQKSKSAERYSVAKSSLPELMKCESRSRGWKTIASLPVHESALCNVYGHLIAVGGDESTGKWKSRSSDNVYKYYEGIDSWVIVSRMSVSRRLCQVAVLPDSKIIVIGGESIEASQSIEIATLLI